MPIPLSLNINGLGLAICQKMLSFLGGKIWLDSSEENGSVFHVFVPDETKFSNS